MNISATVSILILTVFLSLSAPAYAESAPLPPYIVSDYANYTNGTPADGELVTLYKLGDPLTNTTVVVGDSYGSPGWWKANLYEISGNLTDGETVVAEVLGKSTQYGIDLSHGVTPPGGSDGDGGSSSSNGGGSGTPAPTPAATPAPTAAPEPTNVAPTVAQTEAPTGAPTVAQTETENTVFKTNETSGFGAVLTVFTIAGLLVATYLVMRRRE